MGAKRVVIDTNVLISGFRWAGNPRQVFARVLDGTFELIVSEKQLVELRRVLAYAHLNILRSEQERLMNVVLNSCTIIKTQTAVAEIRDDPSDNMLLEAAEESGARYIVSGDKHLLRQKQWKETQIVSPASFLKLIEK